MSFRVADTVLVDGMVVIPRGAAVEGKVMQSRKPGTMGRPGELTVSVDRLFLRDARPCRCVANNRPLKASKAAFSTRQELGASTTSSSCQRGWFLLGQGFFGLRDI